MYAAEILERRFFCLTCGSRVSEADVTDGRATEPPPPASERTTWIPPSKARPGGAVPPKESGTFEAVPSKRMPLRKKA